MLVKPNKPENRAKANLQLSRSQVHSELYNGGAIHNITCESCGSVFQVDPADIGADGRLVRCSSCGHEWMENGINASTTIIAESIGGDRGSSSEGSGANLDKIIPQPSGRFNPAATRIVAPAKDGVAIGGGASGTTAINHRPAKGNSRSDDGLPAASISATAAASAAPATATSGKPLVVNQVAAGRFGTPISGAAHASVSSSRVMVKAGVGGGSGAAGGTTSSPRSAAWFLLFINVIVTLLIVLGYNLYRTALLDDYPLVHKVFEGMGVDFHYRDHQLNLHSVAWETVHSPYKHTIVHVSVTNKNRAPELLKSLEVEYYFDEMLIAKTQAKPKRIINAGGKRVLTFFVPVDHRPINSLRIRINQRIALERTAFTSIPSIEK